MTTLLNTYNEFIMTVSNDYYDYILLRIVLLALTLSEKEEVLRIH